MSWIFFMIQEFAYAPGAADILLNKNFNQSNPWENDKSTKEGDIASIIIVNPHNSKTKCGQPTIVSIFLKIITEATSFLKQQGYTTYCRRRTERDYSSGVTAE